ncbi:MAG: type I 3-dehydroquinate dehydratase, partial [Gammaproteobacteria bacterium]|nr:type I 3-dehydroquinate dehydratase [Gammaproteobacteria bacterium]
CSVEEIKALKKQGLDIAEIRVDLFTGKIVANNVIEVLQKFGDLGVPTILTFRPEREGGNWGGSDAERMAIIADCYQYADMVDIETSSMYALDCSEKFCQLANEILQSETHLLMSYHNFEKTPSLAVIKQEIESTEALLSAKADIVKVACQVNSNADVAVLTEMLLHSGDKNLVVIGMGGHGLITRLSFATYGSLFTFAYVGDTVTAPGQLHIDVTVAYLKDFYPVYSAGRKIL